MGKSSGIDKQINVPQLSLAIREYPNSGDTILFLHFGGANLEMWQGVVPFFEEHYHLVLVDLRGHGKSGKPATGYHIDQMAADIVGVLDALGLDRVYIVGSSLGAEVGLSIAANYPARVLSLVCDGALHSEFGPYGLWEGPEAEFNEYSKQRLVTIRNRPEKNFPSVDALVEDSREMFAPHGIWNEIFEAVKRRDAVKIGPAAYVDNWGRIAEEYTRFFLQYRFEEYYRRVQCPLLMLPDGEMTKGSRQEQVMRGLLSLTPQGKIASLPGWIHPFGWMLTPEQASKVVLSFLGENSDRSDQLIGPVK